MKAIITHSDKDKENYYYLMGVKTIKLISFTGHKIMIVEDKEGNLKIIKL